MNLSAPPAVTGLTLQLRAATRGAHARIDSAFPHGLDCPDAYVRYLMALLPLVQWLHDAWRPAWSHLAPWHEPYRLQQLKADLAHLDAASGPAPRQASAASAAEWLGSGYVLEGSAMGGRLLARDLDRLQREHPRIAGARSFIDALLAEPRRWACFRKLLDSLPGHATGEAVRGAGRGFALVQYQLDAMEVTA